ncbi:Sterol 3-beta-glucosyltransferase [Phytophthora cactorum]|uniref:Sterol 3-beta-glucosyltransferase n=3 Tax=Phytophthora cactorum TaxID=29920 RepID=A0A329S8I3_9STRA|nr:Sterol 3-beta-glucosyltransferase [Phytophthora cactorum]
MYHTTPQETCSSLSAAIESIAGNGLDGLHAAAIALQRSDGHIQLEFAAEDAINLQPPQPSNARSDQIQSLESLRQESDMPNKKLTADGDTDELLLIPPLMNICILIVGTRGDVQPFLAIALRLQEDGHRVRLATHAVYRDFVMSHGIEFYPLGGDPKELAAYMVKTGGNLIPMKIKTLTEDVPRNMQMINEIVLSTWPAVSEADPDGEGPGVPGPPFRAQAIIANPVSYGHVHVAERLGVPLHIMFPQPWVPTMAFPHPLSNLAYTGKWQKRNYLSYKLVDMIMWQGTEGVINEFRTEVLKLHPIRNGDSGSELLLDLSIPHSFMWSPQLVPKPSDWGDLYDVIGTVTLKGPASEYSPSPELEAFLGNDGGPIFVGFGSMVLADPLATTKMIIEAATHAKMRVLIQSSWTDMAGDIDIPGNVFFLGNCPHDWLMPRVSAVVHHGGAGTTAAGLLAGKPTFIVPFFGDQPFWGQAVMSTRVGVPPCPIAQLTTEILHNAFVELANPDLRKRAEAMRDLMLREDGAGEAVRKFYHHLPTQDMWCDLDHQRIAMQWTVHDRIKLCDRCAFIIRERPENHKKKFVRYHCVDYSARGPSSLLTGVATGAIVFAHELTGGLTGVLLQPARGLINGGVVGAVRGAVTGVYYLLVRPVHGAVLFADRAVAGRKNAKREEGHRKLNNVFDRHLMAALGVQDGLADTFCSATSPNAVDIVIFARRKDRKKMLGRMRQSVRHRYCARYESILLAQRAERLAACMEKLLSPITPEGSSLHQQHKASVQPLVRRASSSTRSDTSAAVEATSSRTGSELAIKLRLARLTSAGTVRLTLGIPSESANAVDFSTIAEWEAYASSHVDTTEFMQQNTRSKRSKPANPRIPHMNVCLAAIGTWDNGVKQFVAIGIKLKEQGHRVRVAANERFRTEIMLRGLEFYPLAGAPESVQDFAKFVYESQNAARAAIPGRLGTGAIQAFKELIYSLWPAAYGSDPHGGGANIPGVHFRADSLLWHPLLLGHVHVAERLGIPLQCASLDPLSPTYCFPHPLSSINGLEPTIMTLCQSNLMTYGVVDTTLWHGGVQEVLTQFRAFIGLNKRCDLPDPLVRWEVPHIYLWNPALLPKPLDWGAELSVVGHVTLGTSDGLSRSKRKKREKEGVRLKWPSELAAFACQTPSPPVIYFGVSTRAMTRDDLDKLLQNIDAAAAAPEQKVRIIFQTREIGDKKRAPYQSANVFQVPSDLEYARFFHERNVVAAIHWGEPDITAEALSAGKPVGICGTHSLQHFMACVCEQAQVGMPLIDWKTCTVKSLALNFAGLLKSELREIAKRLSTTFDREQPVNTAVKTFYAKLPLEAMRCDVDPSKLARVFDPPHKLKLSLPVYVAIRDKTKVFVPYKPLRFGGSLPPTFFILGTPVKVSHQAKPSRQFDAVRQTLDLLEATGILLDSRTFSCSSIVSNPGSLVATPEQIEMFWSSVEEEAEVRKATAVAYERLVKKPQRATKREAIMRFFRFRKSTQRREAEQLTSVE